MNSFFDLSKSQKQSLSINELHGYTDRFEINKYKISEKSGKNIKKTKNDLIEELNTIYSTRKDTNTNTDSKSIKSTKSTKLYFDNSHKPEVILWLPDEKNKFNDASYMETMFDKTHIEEKYKVKCNFGSIIYYGDYYIINEKKELIHLKNLSYDEIDETKDGTKDATKDDTKEYVIIPRNITFFLKNSIKFFKKLNTDNFYIGSIQLDSNDDYVIENTYLEKDEKINGINFNYTISIQDNKKDTTYKLEVELNYLGKNGIFNQDYPTYKCFIEKDISLIKIIDFHNKLSNYQFSYIFKKYGPPGINNDPIWTENVLVKDIKKYIGDEDKKEDTTYECILYCNTYEKYLNMENISKQFESTLYINNEKISIMIQKNEFLLFIKSNDFEIYTK